MAYCVTCTKKLKTGDEYIAEPVESKIKIFKNISLGNGFYRFHHWRCIKKVKSLANLRTRNKWVEL